MTKIGTKRDSAASECEQATFSTFVTSSRQKSIESSRQSVAKLRATNEAGGVYSHQRTRRLTKIWRLNMDENFGCWWKWNKCQLTKRCDAICVYMWGAVGEFLSLESAKDAAVTLALIARIELNYVGYASISKNASRNRSSSWQMRSFFQHFVGNLYYMYSSKSWRSLLLVYSFCLSLYWRYSIKSRAKVPAASVQRPFLT